jgi:hypothetical protein
MSCIRMYCFACKRVTLVCDGICECGQFHEENNDGS